MNRKFSISLERLTEWFEIDISVNSANDRNVDFKGLLDSLTNCSKLRYLQFDWNWHIWKLTNQNFSREYCIDPKNKSKARVRPNKFVTERKVVLQLRKMLVFIFQKE